MRAPYHHRGRLLLLVLALLPALGTGPAFAQEEPAVGQVRPFQPAWDPASRRFTVTGEADLPDGAVLSCRVLFGGSPGSQTVAYVRDQRFRFDLPAVAPDLELLPGKYLFEIECAHPDPPKDERQRPAAPPRFVTTSALTVGDPAEGDRIRAGMRASFINWMEELRLAFQVLEAEEVLAIGRIIGARDQAGGKVPAVDAQRQNDLWEDFCRRRVEGHLHALRSAFEARPRGYYISPFSAVEQGFETLLTGVEKWYGASRAEIATLLERKIPEGTDGLKKRDILPGLLRTTHRLYGELGVEGEDWLMFQPLSGARGMPAGGTYVSKVFGFRIDAPPGWEFQTEVAAAGVHPRIAPIEEAKKAVVVVTVDVRDCTECKDARDLDIAAQLAAVDRWPGYRRIDGVPIQVADDTMPGGLRPGYSLLARANEGKVRFIVMEYALYSRRLKRTYTVISLCREESWESLQEDVGRINDSFRVLDRQK